MENQPLPPAILEYLHGRGITDATIEAFGVGYDARGGGWITIPVLDETGALLVTKCRAAPGNDSANKMMCVPSGAGMQLFGRGVFNAPELKHVVICEGEFDAMLLLQNEIAAVTSTAGAGTFKEEWLQSFPQGIEVTLCFDNDDAGEKGREKVKQLFLTKRPDCRLYEIIFEKGLKEGYDVTDWFTDYAHVPGQEAASGLLEARKRVLTGWERRARAQATFSSFFAAATEDKKQDLPIGVPWFDELAPLMKGCVTRIGAPSNTGKSKFSYWIANRAIDKGLKVGIVSTEITKGVVFSFLESERQGRSIRDIFAEGLHMPAERKELYQDLMIFDQRFTKNYMQELLDIIAGAQCDLLIADFAQMFRTEAAASLYERMSNYAQAVSEAVQREGKTAFLDTSQLSNEDHNRSKGNKKADIAGLKGAGELTANADVVLELIRDKEAENKRKEVERVAASLEGRVIIETTEMELAMRKHRYNVSGASMVLEANWKSGTFKKLRDGGLDEEPEGKPEPKKKKSPSLIKTQAEKKEKRGWYQP